LSVTVLTLLGAYTNSNAQLPPSFPTLVISSNGPVAPGEFIGTLGAKGSATNNFNVVLDNSGIPLYETPFTNLWRAVTPCGLIAEAASENWLLKDETFTVVDTFPHGDGHDFKLLPNGHALILGGDNWPVDMSQFVPGGRPDAVLQSLVFWEVDANKQILFQWRARDHLAITDSLDFLDVASVDWTHVNGLTLDPLDNNYLVSLRGFCQILKISRTTGDVIWRLGGKSSDFTFIGEHPENAPYYFIGQHNIHRLANGDLLFFDNGSLQNQGPLAGRTYSRAVEYHLDETNLTATLVWEYRHTPDVLTPTEGIVKRFSNGNTYIGWVSAAQQGSGPVLTEVNASNQVMFEMSIPGFKSQSILNKQVWNSPDLVHSDVLSAIALGQEYDATNAGVSVVVNTLSGSGNELIVSKHDDAVRLPLFSGKEPQVLVPRVTLSGTNIDALAADLRFELPPNDYAFDTPLYPNPTNLTIYERPTVGQGLFVPLPTVYDPVGRQLKVSTTQLGEFIFTYPDLPEVPLAPILYGQATQASVDQEEPVVLQWTPKGFARSYHLQVATDSGFTSLVVDQDGLTNMAYTLSSVPAGTNYYWRVSVSNLGGASDWSTASFAMVPPMAQVTAPNGGEAWQRGLQYFIRWNANFAEDVVIDLYKGGVFLQSIATNANTGAYYWEAGLKLAPGSDYSIAVSSATDAAVSDLSDQPFSIIDAPQLGAGSIASLPDGQLQLTLTVPGAAQATLLSSTNIVDWEILQTVPLTNGSAVFTDSTATNFPCRFYRLRVP
jgi:hypothetical protein